MSRYLQFQVPTSYRAFGTSVLLHLLLLILLLSGIYVTQYRQSPAFTSEEEHQDKAASIMFVDDPSDKPTNNQLDEQANAAQTRPESQPQAARPAVMPMPEIHEEPLPEMREREIVNEYRPTVRRRTPEQARNAWRARPENVTEKTEQIDQREEPHESQLNARQRFGKALHTTLQYQQEERAARMGGQELSRNGKNSALAKKINGEFSQDVYKNYQAAIARTLCYELNKQKIMAIPITLPEVIIIRLVIARDGTLLETELVRGSPTSTDFNEKLLTAVRAAAPYRRFPSQFDKEQYSFMFKIYPTDSMLRDTTTHQKIPITFFLNGKGAY